LVNSWNRTSTFQPMVLQFNPEVPNSSGFGLGEQQDWAKPIALGALRGPHVAAADFVAIGLVLVDPPVAHGRIESRDNWPRLSGAARGRWLVDRDRG
jgi:hypothetical protein